MVKNLPASAGDVCSTPETRRYPGEGKGNPFQCSCLGKPTDRGAWQSMGHKRVGHNLVTKKQEEADLLYKNPNGNIKTEIN